MGFVQGVHRDQLVMFPELLDDYIAEDNPVRFIDAFVDSLDLQALGFERAVPRETGRPPYHPGDLLKLYVYGYLNRIRSSRKLEREANRNVEVMWLLGKLAPDFKTIADFRRDNGQPIRAVWGEFTVLCRRLGLYGGELVAIDGSKFKAVNGRERNFTGRKLKRLKEQAEAKIERYLQELDATDAQETESEKPIAHLERDLGLSVGAIHHWKRQLLVDGEEAFPGSGRVTGQAEVIRRLQRENEVLREEREILNKSHSRVLEGGAKFQFIAKNRKEFSVRRMCQVLGVSRSGYYAWRQRRPSERQEANEALVVRIKAIHAESHGTYGSPRVHAELIAQGIPCNRKRVERLMRVHLIRARQTKRWRARTTDSNHALPVAPNVLNREFTAEAPNQKWVSDITYIPTAEGWLYLATVMDLCSRNIVGWSMASRRTLQLVKDALKLAIAQRQPALGYKCPEDRPGWCHPAVPHHRNARRYDP